MALSGIHKNLVEQGKKLFSNRATLDSFWQETALHFYPEMAEFTTTRMAGEEYADHLSNSFPLLARRTLGDSFAAFLRPTTLDSPSPGVWFSMNAEVPTQDIASKEWLEFATKQQRRLMYSRRANFTRATKEADHSFAAFGQSPLSVQLNRYGNGLLYQNWHLKDVAWTEDVEGTVNAVWRKWKPTATQLVQLFGPNNVAKQVLKFLDKEPFRTVECMHIVMSAEEMDSRVIPKGKDAVPQRRHPWVSIYIDTENETMMEERPSVSKIYIIPRWLTVPGSQYATSPAVTVALADARLIQAITQTILEAGEKFADPPLIGTQEAIRSDVQAFPGGLTWVDSEYDERLGEAIRPLFQGNSAQGLNSSIVLRQDLEQMISKAFYLDTLSLPPADVREMTATEVGHRVSEWIRRALPVFEPLEFEYNGQLIEETFEILLRAGAFGSFNDIPEGLSGADVQFKFESPLHESADRKKTQQFLEAQQVLAVAAQMDPSVVPMLDARVSLREALDGIGLSAQWTRSDTEIDRINEIQQEQLQKQQQMEMLLAGTEGVKNVASATKDMAQTESQEVAQQ